MQRLSKKPGGDWEGHSDGPRRGPQAPQHPCQRGQHVKGAHVHSQKTTEFYFLKDTERLLFVTEKSKHILSTLDENK